MPDGQETRIVDATTGGAKGSKLAAFHLIPWTIIRELAEHFGRGARKYADRNWERGYAWSLSFAALHRHLEAWWSGEDIDDDPSLYVEGEQHVARHIIAVVWHALVLAFFSRYHVGTDDRPVNVRPPEPQWDANGHVAIDGQRLTVDVDRLVEYVELNAPRRSAGPDRGVSTTIRSYFYGRKGNA